MIVLLLRLYWEFFLVGLFSMGGGMATVPFLFDLSARTGWFTTADLTTMIAISEATPGHLCGLCLRGNPRQHHRAPGPCDPRGDHHSSCLQNSQYPLAKPEGQRTLLRPAPRLRRPDWRSGFFCVRGLIVQHGTGPCSPLALYPAVRNHAGCDESSQAERASLCLLHRSCRSGRYCFSNGGLSELR